MFGPDFDFLGARIDGSGASWYLTDQMGSVRGVTNSSGTVTGTQSFDAFGNGTSTGTGLDRYGYTGRENDSTLSLQYSRARMYDPGIGRWTSRDPSGFDAGDANLYRYVGNGATNATDPSGLEANALGDAIGQAAGVVSDVRGAMDAYRQQREAERNKGVGISTLELKDERHRPMSPEDLVNGNWPKPKEQLQRGPWRPQDRYIDPSDPRSWSEQLRDQKPVDQLVRCDTKAMPEHSLTDPQFEPNKRDRILLLLKETNRAIYDYIIENNIEIDAFYRGTSEYDKQKKIFHVDHELSDSQAAARVAVTFLFDRDFEEFRDSKLPKFPAMTSPGFRRPAPDEDLVRRRYEEMMRQAEGTPEYKLAKKQWIASLYGVEDIRTWKDIAWQVAESILMPDGLFDILMAVLGAKLVKPRYIAAGGAKFAPTVDVVEAPKTAVPEKPSLVDPKGQKHILEGDGPGKGGGHRPGTGKPGKSEFPEGWSDGKILGEVSDIATDPAIRWTRPDARGYITGTKTVDGVDIKVVIDTVNGRIVTGFPTNLPRNP